MQIKQFLHKKSIYLILCLVGCSIFSIYYFFMSRGMILHADDAYQGVYWYNMLTAGNEKIYRLNLTFDTLISLLAYFMTGISLNTPFIAYAIIYSILIWITICLSIPQGKKPSYLILPIILYIMGCVNYQAVLIFRAHMGIIILAYIGFICLDYISFADNPKYRNLVFFILICSLVFGRLAVDFLFLIFAFFPIILVKCINYIKERKRNDIYVVIIAVLSYFVSSIIEHLKETVFTVMSRPAGEHTNTVIFGNFDTLEHNFHNLVYGLLHMFDAYFLNENMLQVKTFFWFINCCIIIFGLGLAARSMFLFYKSIRYHNTNDDISTMISIGIIGVILSFLLTQVATDYTCWRYAICIFTGIVVLISRYLYQRGFLVSGKPLYAKVLCIIFIMFIPLNYQKIPESKASDERDRLATFLQSQELTSGFCDLWHASYLDAASHGQLHMIPLNYGENGYFQWGTRFENWHADYFDFIIEDTTMPIRQFTYDNIVHEFGEPENTLDYDKYRIYIYDYDISTHIVWEDNLTCEQYKLEQTKNRAKPFIEYVNTTHNDIGDYYLSNGSRIIGPRLLLETGNYKLTIAGKNLNKVEIFFPFLNDISNYEITKQTSSQWCVNFTLTDQQLIHLFTIENNGLDNATYYYYGLYIK